MSPAERIAGAVAAVLIGLAGALILWLIYPRTAAADPVGFDCVELATVISGAADFRDTGADLDKTVKLIRRQNAQVPPAHRAVLEREIRKMWAEDLPKNRATLGVYKRCQAQFGDMGRES